MITKYKIFEAEYFWENGKWHPKPSHHKKNWTEYDLDHLVEYFFSSDDFYEDDSDEFLTNKFYGKKVNFTNEYGDIIMGTLGSILVQCPDRDEGENEFYIKIEDKVYCMSYDNHILKVYEETQDAQPEVETKIRWYKGGKLQEGLNYDFKVGDKVIVNSNISKYHWNHLEKYIGQHYTIIAIEKMQYYDKVAYLSTLGCFFPFDCLTLANFEDDIGKVRWYKKGKLHEKIEEYPFIENISLIDIGQDCVPHEDEIVDCERFQRKLSKLLLNRLCEFQEDVTGQDSDVLNINANSQNKIMKLGEIVKGVVTKVEVFSWFDYDVTIKFTVGDIEYEVNPYHDVKVFLKEERKRKIGDPNIDPYGEEDWDD